MSALRKTIVCDLDGPLTQNEEYIINKYKDVLGKQITKENISYSKITLPGSPTLDVVNFLDEEYFKKVLPVKGAFEALRKLNKDNYITLVTARFINNSVPNMVNITMKWLEQLNFGNDNDYTTPELISASPEERYKFLTGDEFMIEADYYIDDNPSTITNMLALISENPNISNCKLILFQKEYNKHLDFTHPQFKICRNWAEILEFIHKDSGQPSTTTIDELDTYSDIQDEYDGEDMTWLIQTAEQTKLDIKKATINLLKAAESLDTTISELIKDKEYARLIDLTNAIEDFRTAVFFNVENIMDIAQGE